MYTPFAIKSKFPSYVRVAKYALVRNREAEERLRETTQKLKEMEERYQHLVAGTHGLICTHDLEGVLTSINPSACELLGFESSEILGRNLVDFIPPSRRPFFPIFLDRIKANSVDKGVLNLIARDGRELTFQYHNIKITQGVEKPYILGHAYDITELIDLQKKLTDLSVTDELTGLYNTRGFLSRASDKINLARRVGEGLDLIFADIDGLKKINDTLGHAAGTQLITDTAEILKGSFRQTDVICRWGGDEFVILLATSMESSSRSVTERVQRKIDDFNARCERPYQISVSFGGVTIDPQSEKGLEDIIKDADESMYEQKRSRKER